MEGIMHIQNRAADVKALITHALQDYFILDIVSQYPSDGWKQDFNVAVNNGINDPNLKVNYIETWNKVQRIGLASYTVQDMDISILLTVFASPQFRKHVNRGISKLFGSVRETRNLDSHNSYNQECSLLFQEAHGALQILRNFVKAVADHSPSSQKLSFYQKYDQEINKLSQLLESDYDEWRRECERDDRMNREIAEILQSSDPFRTYYEIMEGYRLTRDIQLQIQLQTEFGMKAAEAGIPYGCSFLGDLYFEGLMRPVDYEKAAELYEMGIDRLAPHQVLNLASIYINQLSTKRSKEDGLQMVASCNPGSRKEICTYPTEDGYTFYGLQRKKN